MNIAPTIDPDRLKQAVDYYTANHEEVYVVKCDQCDDTIAVEVRDAVPGLQVNEIGLTIITLSDKLASSRARHDTDEQGNRIMGYHCVCGNNSILAEIEEKAYIETAGRKTSFDLLPHEFPAFKAKLDELLLSHKRTTEPFTRQRVK